MPLTTHLRWAVPDKEVYDPLSTEKKSSEMIVEPPDRRREKEHARISKKIGILPIMLSGCISVKPERYNGKYFPIISQLKPDSLLPQFHSHHLF